MRAARVEALMLFPLASSANCFFHASKPTAVLPHCAAPTLPVIHRSATKTATVTVLSCPPLVIAKSFHSLHQTKRWLAIPAGTSRHRRLSRSYRSGLPVGSPFAKRLSLPGPFSPSYLRPAGASTSVFPKWARTTPKATALPVTKPRSHLRCWHFSDLSRKKTARCCAAIGPQPLPRRHHRRCSRNRPQSRSS